MPFIDHKPPDPQKVCRSPEHNPPSMMVLPPGTHTWQCPACGHTVTFIVPGHSWITGSVTIKPDDDQRSNTAWMGVHR